jgi:cytochrome c oxidase subunit 2
MRSRAAASSIVAATLFLTLVACGDDDSSEPRAEGPAGEGQDVFDSQGCSGCHSTSGGSGTGPPLDGIYGEEVTLTDGSTVERDDEYLTRAIQDPSADIVEGFSPQMPDFGLDDDEVAAVIAYIRSLSN